MAGNVFSVLPVMLVRQRQILVLGGRSPDAFEIQSCDHVSQVECVVLQSLQHLFHLSLITASAVLSSCTIPGATNTTDKHGCCLRMMWISLQMIGTWTGAPEAVAVVRSRRWTFPGLFLHSSASWRPTAMQCWRVSRCSCYCPYSCPCSCLC